MVPNVNIGGRTFCIRSAQSQGTAFTMDINGRRYLITAQHVIGRDLTGSISIETNSGPELIDVDLVGHSAPEIDVSVLKPVKPIHEHRFRADVLHFMHSPIQVGEDVYSFGFPLGLSTKVFNFPEFSYPIPLLRKCMVSGFDTNHVFLDGFANPGASGGPVFRMDGKVPRVFGVGVARYEEPAIVVTEQREPSGVATEQREPSGQVALNSGIVTVTKIEHVTQLITRNPIGLRI